jgi:lactate permease
MNFFLAIMPILTVLALMLLFRLGGQIAGPVGWLAGLGIAAAAFGLNWDVLWVSQVKGLLLALNVLLILWPAIYLYNLVNAVGGIQALSNALAHAISDPGLLVLALGWAFASAIEGIAGFGLPMAIVAPMLVGLGVPPIAAVAAPSIGHGWAVTFGNIGLVWQTTLAVVQLPGRDLAPIAALLLGIACVLCGLAVAWVLGLLRRWKVVLAMGLAMAAVQYGMVMLGLPELGSFFASLTGLGIAAGVSRRRQGSRPTLPRSPALRAAVLAYGLVIFLMVAFTLIPPVKAAFSQVVLAGAFPQVTSNTGWVTPAGTGQVFRPLLHPGSIILFATLVSYRVFRRWFGSRRPVLFDAARATVRAAGPATIGTLAMVGLSSLMEHTGMTMLLAQGMAAGMGATFPLVSPLVGMLGAFATGSNTNSNVLFAVMQRDAANLLGLSPAALVAAQTTGGSLGSMLAPAKIMVGVSTVGLAGRDGEVLRRTLPIGLVIGLLAGLLALLLA